MGGTGLLVGVWKRRDCTDFSRFFREGTEFSERAPYTYQREEFTIYIYLCILLYVQMHRTLLWYLSPPPPITYNMYIQGMLHIFAYKYLQNYIWYVMSNTYTHCYFLCLCVQRNRELEATEGLLKCGKSFGIRKVHVKNLK